MVNPNIYVLKKRNTEPSHSINNLFRLKDAKGEVGVEVEVEGNKFPKPPNAAGSHHKVAMPNWKYWSYCHDGSLRGQDNAEYVLTKPVMFSEVNDAIDELFANLNAYGSVLDESNRTSVHVHLNFQEFFLNRLATFCGLWFCFEEILTQWCGDHRVGNLFCLRGKDAPAITTLIKEFIKRDGAYDIRDNFHYSGLNVNALQKFGSIEIRTMRGATDPEIIKAWLRILERFYKASGDYNDPRNMVDQFSALGPVEFFHTFLGPDAFRIIQDLSLTQEDIYSSMLEGIRLAQDICYCRPWEDFNPVVLKPDPFGRDKKKVTASLNNYVVNMMPTLSQAMDYETFLNSQQTLTVGPAWAAPGEQPIHAAPPAPAPMTPEMEAAAAELDAMMEQYTEAYNEEYDEDYNPDYEEM